MKFFSFFILLIFPLFINATIISGKVIKIVDGDTFDLLMTNNQTVRIRLADIDAPEKRQDFGTVSKQALADYIFTKNIKVEYTKLDRNHRIIGTIWINNENVNLKMVENGFAWHFKKYSTSKLFAKAEIRAKSMKKGLWVQNNAIAPWDFRHKKH